MFKSIGSVLGNGGVRKADGAILAIQIRQITKKIISETLRDFGLEVLSQINVKTYRNGKVVITAPNVILAEMHMRENELIDGINKSLGHKVIYGLRFRVST